MGHNRFESTNRGRASQFAFHGASHHSALHHGARPSKHRTNFQNVRFGGDCLGVEVGLVPLLLDNFIPDTFNRQRRSEFVRRAPDSQAAIHDPRLGGAAIR